MNLPSIFHAFGLGHLRLLFALLVINVHYGFFRTHIQPHILETFPQESLAIINDGVFGVYGFFFISGYVITLVLDKKYDAGHWPGLGEFYLNRVLRVFPLYWFSLILLALVQDFSDLSPAKFLANVFLLPYGIWAFFMDHTSQGKLFDHFYLVPAWTLALDLVFYLMAPLLLATHRRSPWPFWAFVAVSLLYVLMFAFVGERGYAYWHINFWTSGQSSFLAFLLGMAGYFHRKRIAVPGWGLGLAILVLLYVSYLPYGLGSEHVAFLLGMVAVLTVTVFLSKRPMSPNERFLGDYTYALYLLHIPVIVALHSFMSGHGLPVVALALSMVLAFPIAKYVEGGFDQVRRRFRSEEGGKRPSVAEGTLPGAFLLVWVTFFFYLGACGLSLYYNL